MILQRKKNAIRNIFYGLITRIISLVFPFVCRTVVIHELGVEYLGLNSLFTSILSVLSLAELGFGSALVFSMYKPIAKNDKQMICALLNYYKKIYHCIGFIIVFVGICLIPFLDYFIDGNCPDNINITIIYLINLVSTVSTYLLFAYKNSILIAHQRNDIINRVECAKVFLQNVIQIGILFLFKNYYLYIIVVPLFNIIGNVIVAIMANLMYPEYQPHGEIDKTTRKEIKKKVSSLFTYKIGNVVGNSVDNIVISAFLGLSAVAMYGNYYYVISALFGFLSVYYNSMLAGLGNSFQLDCMDKNYQLFQKLFFVQSWLIGWICICLLCLYQPFMELWVGKKYMFDMSLVVLLTIYFYVWKIHDIVHIFKDAAGLWEYDKLRPLISSVCNLIINVILVQQIGIYGIVISTVICEFVFSTFWAVPVLFKYFFHVNVLRYYFNLFRYTLINIMVSLLTFVLVSKVRIDNLFLRFLVQSGICCIVPNVAYCLLYFNNPYLRGIINELSEIKALFIRRR